ncbi:MAG: sugar phosphate isomerase/epimerase family protein [Anaerolineae bacterium]|nr:sugar phosphate isomerase/epimerase [Chloroflexota bacterium]
MTQIGCNTLYGGGSLGAATDYTVADLKRSLERNAALGYDTVEYSHLCHLTCEQAAEVGACTRNLGMQPWSVHSESAGSFVLGATAEEASAGLLHAVEVCKSVGATVVVVHAPLVRGLSLGDLPDVPSLVQQDLVGLGEPVARAAELGVELALENGRTLAHWVYIQALLERINQPHVGACVDAGHANLGDLGAPRAIRMAGKRLLTLHLHDNLGEVDDHLPPGRGTIDWAELLAALAEVGYHRTLQLELTDRAAHREYDQALEQRQGIENMRRFVAARG